MEELSKKATMYIRRYVFECFQNDFPNASKEEIKSLMQANKADFNSCYMAGVDAWFCDTIEGQKESERAKKVYTGGYMNV